MPTEAADCIREYFCANESGSDEDEGDIDEPVVSTSDILPTASSSTDANKTLIAPAATFDRPLISSSTPAQPQSTASGHDEFWLKEEAAAVDEFLPAGCGCQKQCHTKFSKTVIINSKIRLFCIRLL